MKSKLAGISGLIGLLFFTMVYFNNCGQVEFGSTNDKPATLEVDPGNNGNGLPPGDGDDPTDLPPPPGHRDGDGCRGGHKHDHHHHGDGCKRDHDGNHEGDDDHEDEDDHEWNKHHGCNKSCGNNGVKDIIVNIDHIEIRGTHGEVLTLAGDLGETSIIGGTLPIFVSEDIDIVSVRLVLKDSGNVLIDDDNKSFNLKTPSGQQSGLKISFKGILSVEGGAYNLSFRIDTETQIVKAGKKCLLKPVLQFVSFKPI